MVKWLKSVKKLICCSKSRNRRKNNEQPEPPIFKLNDDCLETLFGHLSLKDLYKIAEVDERFLWAARLQFKRKLGNGLITMDCFEICIYPANSSGMKIYIGDSSVVDKFFKNFGPVLKKIEVYIRGHNRVDRVILKHCNKSTADVQVYRMWSAITDVYQFHFPSCLEFLCL